MKMARFGCVFREIYRLNSVSRPSFCSLSSLVRRPPIVSGVELRHCRSLNEVKSGRSNHVLLNFARLNSTEVDSTQQVAAAISASKRLARKRTKKCIEGQEKDNWYVVAYAAAEEYDLEKIEVELNKQGVYVTASLPEDLEDALRVSAKYQVDKEPREFFIFREGSVVFWNIPELERVSVLKFLKIYSEKPYDELLTQDENEFIQYCYGDQTKLLLGKIFLDANISAELEKYTFSNALSLSVKLAIWENNLERFVESIEDVTEDLKSGKKIKLSRAEVIRKMGELFALRHFINLSSDLLDTPDFYWERENLEPLYQKTCSYLSIAKRTKVMNEKMNHCSELMQLLNDHLNDHHHVRLELMIIALIMIEVMFEAIHWIV